MELCLGIRDRVRWAQGMNAKRILVTGASGFIGKPLVRALIHAGYTVRAATRSPVSFPNVVDVAIVPDFINPTDWKPILCGIDIVIHAAGLAHIPQFEAHGMFDYVNRVATQELSCAAARAGVERFLFISSVRAQTGISAMNTAREQDTARPTNPYGRSKLAAELAIQAARVPFTILRPVVVYGPHPKGNFESVVRLALSPFPLPFAGFNNRRSLLGIDNLISAVLFTLNNPATLGETFLVADPKPVTIRELFTVLRKAQGRRPRLVNIPPNLFKIAFKITNRMHLWDRLSGELIVDTTKLESLGWRPAVETYNGLRALLSIKNDEALAASDKSDHTN